MARAPVTDKWDEIRRAAEQGVPIKILSSEYNIDEGTMRQRSKRENWLTPVRMQNKLAALSRNAQPACSGPLTPPEKASDNTKVVELVAETWEQRASSVRNLAWQIGQSSLRGLDKTGIPIRDAGDVAKMVKVMREATGLFAEQAAVQVSVFSGQSVGFDGKTVETDTEIIDVATDYEEEM